MEKESLTLFGYRIIDLYMAAFATIGAILVFVVISEIVFFGLINIIQKLGL